MKYIRLEEGIYKGDDHHYKVDFQKTAGGKRIHYFASNLTSLRSARKKKEEFLLKHQEDKERRKETITFEEFLSSYLRHRSFYVRESSLYQARAIVNRYFLSSKKEDVRVALGFDNLHKIYGNLLEEASLSISWKNKLIGGIRDMVKYASTLRFLDKEEAEDGLAMLKNIPDYAFPQERSIWKESEEKRFLGCIKDKQDKLMFSLFLYLGARLGEFLALRWDAFDSHKGEIRIFRQLRFGSRKNNVLSPLLKTKDSYRVCPLSKELRIALEEERKTSSKKGFIFSIDGGENPISKASFRGRMERYIALSKVRRITPHDVRHGVATKLLKVCKNMMEIRAAARFLGHSPAIFINVYSHSDETSIASLLKRASHQEKNKNSDSIEFFDEWL